MSYFSQVLHKIDGPLSDLQLREVMVELAHLNLHLKDRPTFATECDVVEKKARIRGFRPQLELLPLDRRMRGTMLLNAVKHALPSIRVAGLPPASIPAAIESGDVTFLWDDDGNFMRGGQFQHP